jgi:hypothetical protein
MLDLYQRFGGHTTFIFSLQNGGCMLPERWYADEIIRGATTRKTTARVSLVFDQIPAF